VEEEVAVPVEGGGEGGKAGPAVPALPEGAIPVPKEGVVEGGGEEGHRHEAGHEQGGHEEYGPGCHPVCEPEPNHAMEVTEFLAMALFTIGTSVPFPSLPPSLPPPLTLSVRRPVCV